MRTSAIVLVSLAGFGFALWLARSSDPPHSPTASPAPAGGSSWRGSAATTARGVATTTTTSTAAPAVKLDPKSEGFRKRIDDQIPARLYSEASHCYKGGMQRDQRLDLTYRIRVRNGDVTIGDIRTVESTLGNVALEQCIRDRLSAMSWREERLPDLEETDDLFMRVAGFSAYLANAEADDDDAPGSAMN